jgi:hypothetical protein
LCLSGVWSLISFDLSIYADNSYTTDIWYWKACRSDPMGFADDKISTLSMIKRQNAAKIISKKGFTYYSKRKGDEGKAAYQDIEIPIDFHGDTIPLFKNIVPSESRADIIAKGVKEREDLQKANELNEKIAEKDTKLAKKHASMIEAIVAKLRLENKK